MVDQPTPNDNDRLAAIERLLDEDASLMRSDAPAGLDDRIFMASQRALSASPPSAVLYRIRWAAPLAAAAMLAIATTLFWPSLTTKPSNVEDADITLLEADVDAVVLATDIESELAELDAFLESLDALEESFAMNWNENVSLLESEFDAEEIVQ